MKKSIATKPRKGAKAQHAPKIMTEQQFIAGCKNAIKASPLNSFRAQIFSASRFLDGGDPTAAVEFLQSAIPFAPDLDLRKLAEKACDEAQLGTIERAEFYCDEILQLTAPDAGELPKQFSDDDRADRVTHTEGPWKADADCKGGFLVYQHGPSLGKSGNAEDCPPIAELKMIGPNKEANAHLIAAAPDLLSAGENLLEMFEESHAEEIRTNHHGDGSQGCSYCAAIKQMRASIACARG